jgi:hypothetical protein
MWAMKSAKSKELRAKGEPQTADRGFRVPTSVGHFLPLNYPTKVGTLNALS